MIFALEGPSFAGKSSVADFITQALSRVVVIPEYNEVAGGGHNFPMPQTQDEAEEAISFFVRLEEVRQELIISTLADGKIPLQDRSLFTCIGFDYAMARVGGYNIWHKTRETFLSQGFVKPNVVFFFEIDHATQKKRQEASGYQVFAPLVNPVFNDAFREYFLRDVARLTQVSAIDANKSTREVASIILGQITAVA